MADYLLTGAVTNALNMPSVTAEEAPKLKPFVALAEKLGSVRWAVADGGLSEVEIEYEGAVAQLNRKPLTSAALAGCCVPSSPKSTWSRPRPSCRSAAVADRDQRRQPDL
jgi:D-3-phosphoglycerate dehydrogenase